MRSRAPYTECSLYVDGIPELKVGDYLVTPAGSAYRVDAMRQNRNQPRRRHLRCTRWPEDAVPVDRTVWKFYWYPRKKRAPLTMGQMRELMR